MSDGRVCPQCSTEYGEELRFCPRDGTALRPRHTRPDLVGQIIAERYHVTRKLGEGGMGEVYLAEHVKMGRACALKVIRKEAVHEADALARFTREAGNASRIAHPNVAAIYDFGETHDGIVFLAMEYVEGESLHAVLQREGPLEPGRAATITAKVADALGDAHALGIVHRDLKPENIMIGRARDGGDVVKVVDFGIAKAVEGERQTVTRTGFVIGTPDYMSPEQLSGEPLSGQSDQYALALVAFHMLTGSLPFPGKTEHESMVKRLTERPVSLAQARPGITWPAGLQDVFDRALARHPDERFESVGEFAEAFRGALSTERGLSREPRSREPLSGFGKTVEIPDTVESPRLSGRRAKQSGLLGGIMIGGVVALVAAGGGLIIWRSGAGARSAAEPSTEKPVPAGGTAPNDSSAGERTAATAPVGTGTAAASTAVRDSGVKDSSVKSAGEKDAVAQDAVRKSEIVVALPPNDSAGPPRRFRDDRGRGGRSGGMTPRTLPAPTGNPTLDSAMASVRRGMAVVDSIAKLDPQAFQGLRSPTPGSRPQPGGDVPPPADARDFARRSAGARHALDGIEAVVDAAVAGRVTEQDLLRARQVVERLEREPGPMDEKRRARMNGVMIQALLTHSQADCRTLRSTENVARRSPAQLARLRSAVAAACGT